MVSSNCIAFQTASDCVENCIPTLHIGNHMYLNADDEEIGTIVQDCYGEDFEIVRIATKHYWVPFSAYENATSEKTQITSIIQGVIQGARLKKHTPYCTPYPGGFIRFMKDKLVHMKHLQQSEKEKAVTVRRLWDELIYTDDTINVY